MTQQESKREVTLPYLKLFPEEYLAGSLHFNNSFEEQGFFVALLCLAGKNRKERGTLSLERGKPMTMKMIANALFTDTETCSRLMAVMAKQDRVTYREDGVIVITKFDYYQKYYRTARNKRFMSPAQEKAIAGKLAGKYPETAIFKATQSLNGKEVK